MYKMITQLIQLKNNSILNPAGKTPGKNTGYFGILKFF